jgi:methylmalonyl-CoA mutase cobalamin-binding domain/chain
VSVRSQPGRSAVATAVVAPKRVLLAKPGLDGHDRGVKIIAKLLRDSGIEVIYTGIRQSPAMIARAAVQEDVSVVGLSILSGAHMRLGSQVLDALAAEGAEDIKLLIGGTIPHDDVVALRELGVDAVFGVESTLEQIREWFESA